jgi:hypothetical protein
MSTPSHQRSDELARSLLAPLNDGRGRPWWRRWLRSSGFSPPGLVEIRIEDPASSAAQFCLRSYFAELDSRFDTGFDPEASISAGPADLAEPAGGAAPCCAWKPTGC